jgi:hypothetical protein
MDQPATAAGSMPAIIVFLVDVFNTSFFSSWLLIEIA